MKKVLLLIIVLVFPFMGQSQQKTLVWSDEFDYYGLPDSSNWNILTGKARTNNEPQYWTNDFKNIVVKDGKLIITCLIEEVDGETRYTSARIESQNKFEVTGGRIEARAKLPQGRGVWPAIWTLGSNIRQVGWPSCGEIDIMEYWGHNPNTIGSNVHTGDYNHRRGTGRGGEIEYESPYEDFHIYAVEWYDDRLDFYMNDTMFYSCEKKGEGVGEWPFDAPQYLIINFALWNNWRDGQAGIDDSIFPQQFIIDYIRVYDIK